MPKKNDIFRPEVAAVLKKVADGEWNAVAGLINEALLEALERWRRKAAAWRAQAKPTDEELRELMAVITHIARGRRVTPGGWTAGVFAITERQAPEVFRRLTATLPQSEAAEVFAGLLMEALLKPRAAKPKPPEAPPAEPAPPTARPAPAAPAARPVPEAAPAGRTPGPEPPKTGP